MDGKQVIAAEDTPVVVLVEMLRTCPPGTIIEVQTERRAMFLGLLLQEQELGRTDITVRIRPPQPPEPTPPPPPPASEVKDVGAALDRLSRLMYGLVLRVQPPEEQQAIRAEIDAAQQQEAAELQRLSAEMEALKAELAAFERAGLLTLSEEPERPA